MSRPTWSIVPNRLIGEQDASWNVWLLGYDDE
jgi:hypothetical protein